MGMRLDLEAQSSPRKERLSSWRLKTGEESVTGNVRYKTSGASD
jgi:hypothetical protein